MSFLVILQIEEKDLILKLHKTMKYTVTGGAGFIGSHIAESCYKKYTKAKIIIIDKFTYAGFLSNLKNILKDNKELSLVVKSPLITPADKLNIFESLLKKINANELTNTFIKVIRILIFSYN